MVSTYVVNSDYNASYGFDIVIDESNTPVLMEMNGVVHAVGNRSYEIYKDDRVAREVCKRILNCVKEPYPPLIYFSEFTPYMHCFRNMAYDRGWINQRFYRSYNYPASPTRFPDKYNVVDSKVGLVVGAWTRYFEVFYNINPKLLVNPPEVELLVRRKDITYALMKDVGFERNFPKTLILPCNTDELISFLDNTSGDTVLKKPKASSGGRGIELLEKYNLSLDIVNEDTMLQEYVNHTLIDGHFAVARVSYTKGFVDAFWKTAPQKWINRENDQDVNSLICSSVFHGGVAREVSNLHKSILSDFVNDLIPKFEKQILDLNLREYLYERNFSDMVVEEENKLLKILKR